MIWRRAARGVDFGRGFPPHPTPFLCFAKEKGEKKGDPGVAVSPVLLESQGRHGMARRLRRRLAVADGPLTFCDARRATRGTRRAKRHGRRVELRHTRLCAIYGAFGPLSCVWLSVAEPTVTMFCL